ncbi:complement C1q tumor necrosis factor-related protein 3-like [Engraulis encrasicolus]|uniref:complement C1q tumor necrosis factor-related protein 3-like n=1 Tax=Engraulis encrasicolus TaxID=184585 RepID=UPI002FD4870D
MMKTPGAVLLLLLWLVACVGAADQCLPQVTAELREMSRLLEQQRVEFTNAKAALEKKIQETQTQKDAPVAFSASFDMREDLHIGPFNQDTTLVFNYTFTNVGNHYNTSTGVFTAPVCGVYQFHYHVFASGVKGTGANLERNGHHVVSAYNHLAPDGHDVNTSQTVSIELREGDKVCLRLERGWWVAAYTAHQTTFSGQLLFEAKQLPSGLHPPLDCVQPQ